MCNVLEGSKGKRSHDMHFSLVAQDAFVRWFGWHGMHVLCFRFGRHETHFVSHHMQGFDRNHATVTLARCVSGSGVCVFFLSRRPCSRVVRLFGWHFLKFLGGLFGGFNCLVRFVGGSVLILFCGMDSNMKSSWFA